MPSAPRRLALPLLLAVLPAVWLASHVLRNWVNVPVSDEWSTSVGFTLAKAREHTLSLPYLFSQHTESRPLFPRLVALVLNAGGGAWDVRRGMVLNLALAAGISALCWRLLDCTRSAASRLWVLAAMNILLFSPAGWEIWLWGQGYLVLLALLCLAGTLAVNTTGWSLGTKAAVNAALAFVGTFTFANGLLLWFLAWPQRTVAPEGEPETATARGDFLPRALYVAAGLASFALFFGGGYRSANPAALPYALAHPLAAAGFFLAWCAGPFLPAETPHAAHGVIGVALVGIFVAGAGRAWRAHRPTARPWVLLGGFALASGLLAAAGRTASGAEFALSSRYAVTAVLLPVAALGVWWTAAGRAGWHAGWKLGAGFLLVEAAILQAGMFPDAAEKMRGAREAREKAVVALGFLDLMPDNPQLHPIFPDVARNADALRVPFHRLLDAGLLHFPAPAPALEAALAKAPAPPGVDAGAAGHFDVCAPHGPEQLTVSGWATDPAGAPGARAARFVVFQWTPLDAAGHPAGPSRPWTLLPVDRARPDVAAVLGGRPEVAACGFSEAIYRPLSPAGRGPGRVAAWAVDPAVGRARQLTGTFDVPAAPPAP